jgi:VWFA-related protein
MPTRIRHARTLVTASAAALWFAAVIAARPEPQQSVPPPQQPTFRSHVDLVQLDVTAVDGDNKPVRGLKAEDFTIYDRKKPQPIVAFEEISHQHTRDVSPLAALPPTLKHDVADNQTATSDRLVVMVIDDLHLFKGRTDRTKDIARKVVNDLGAQATMGVLFTSGEHNIETTEDRSELLAAIDTLKGRKLVPRPVQGPESGRGGDLQTFEDNMQTNTTLEDAARVLATGTPQRKAFVYLSEGVAKDLDGMYTSDVTPCEGAGELADPLSPCLHSVSLAKMMGAMQQSNVTTYAIDLRGAVPLANLAAECRPSPAGKCDPCMGDCPPAGKRPGQLPAHDAWVRLAEHGLDITAKASGGFAITNTDDFTSGLDRIIEDLDHYYLLGFSPADPDKTGFRALDVKVNRPGITLHFRSGYTTAGAPPPPKNSDPVVALSAGPMPRTDLALRLSATALLTRTVLALEVSEPRLSLSRADGSVSDSLRYAVLAVDLKTGKTVREFRNTAELNSRPGATVGDIIVFQEPVELALPPGRYQLRASASSAGLAKGGSVYLALDVPDYTTPPIAVSGLLLGYADGPHVAISKPAAGRAAVPVVAAIGVNGFAPSLDRVFMATDTVRLYGELLTRAPAVIRRVAVDLVDASGHMVKTFTPELGPTGDRVDQRIPLVGLPPGAYLLRVTATGQVAQTVRREIGFAIK